jgi:hypothetical protein
VVAVLVVKQMQLQLLEQLTQAVAVVAAAKAVE